MHIFRQVAIVLCVFIVSEFSQTVNNPKQENPTIYTVDNCVNQFDSAKVIPTNAGYQYWFVDKTFLDGRTLKMGVVNLQSATHPPHKHAEDEFFFVLEGTAEFHLNGKPQRSRLMPVFIVRQTVCMVSEMLGIQY